MDTLTTVCKPEVGTQGEEEDRYRLVGVVERVTFRDHATGYSVLRVRASEHPRPVTLVGTVADVSPGARLQSCGRWSRHLRYGMQFVAKEISISPPEFAGALEMYLGSGFASGVGPVHAKRLIEAFGPQALDVAEREPLRLRSVRGIGPSRAAALCSAALHRGPASAVSTPSTPRPAPGRRGGKGDFRS